MISRLSNYIDKDAFFANVSYMIKRYDKIILDSFVSNTCNLNCSHCYFLDYKPILRALSYEDWERIIEEAVGFGIRHFHFSGKEPLADKRIPQVLARLNSLKSEYNLFYGFVSNGTLFKLSEVNELLNSNISYLELSLEGNRAHNDSIRGHSHYQVIEDLIKRINRKDKVNITSTITDDNIESLLDMINQMIENGISKFNIAPLLVFNKNQLMPLKETSIEAMLSFYNGCRKILTAINDGVKKIDIRICFTQTQAYELFVKENILTNYINSYIYQGEELVFRINDHIIEFNYPLLSIPYLFQLVVTHDGYVISCADDIHYQDISGISLGNLHTDSLSDILLKRKKYIIEFLNKKLA